MFFFLLVDPEVLEEMDRAKPTGGKDAAAANPLAGFDPAAWLAGTNQKPPAGNAITSGSSGPKFKVAGGGGGGTQRKRRDW